MAERLWAPWRMEYIESVDDDPGCVFCRAWEGADDGEMLVVHRGAGAFVLLNKFPYTSGHLMVAPTMHTGDLGALPRAVASEIHQLTVTSIEVLGAVMTPQGYNLGWNLGRVAGAGVIDHVHQHIVPRWAGDTNFMPVLADVKVVPEHLSRTRTTLAEAWPA